MAILPPKPRKQWTPDDLDELETRMRNVETKLETSRPKTYGEAGLGYGYGYDALGIPGARNQIECPSGELEIRPLENSEPSWIEVVIPAMHHGERGAAVLEIFREDFTTTIVDLTDPSGRIVLVRLLVGHCDYLGSGEVRLAELGRLDEKILGTAGTRSQIRLYLENPTLCNVPVRALPLGWRRLPSTPPSKP
jgi:hypothetical protein